MKLIVLIDDSAVHRRVAGYELSTRSGIYIPQTARDIAGIDGNDVGLLILDRHLASDWQKHADDLVKRLRPETEIIEWTAATRFDTHDKQQRVIDTLQKTGGARELAAAVNRWIKTGTARQPAMV